LSEERFQKHKDGFSRLIEQVEKTGAKIVLVSTPPFDPVPLNGKLLPDTAEKFSWMTPYAKYDDVLTAYSNWLLSFRKKGYLVIDVHSAVNRHLRDMRKTDANYRLANDGIHPNSMGHWLWAAEILTSWNAPAEINLKVVGKKITGSGGLRLELNSGIPMPVDPRLLKNYPEARIIRENLNRYRHVLKNLPYSRYELMEGNTKLGEVDKMELDRGLNLLRFPELSTNQRSQKLLKEVEKRQQMLGRAWLTDVGHDRPNTPKGIPLNEALQKAKQMEEQIRSLARPTQIMLELRPVQK